MAVHTCNPNIQRRVGYTAASTDCAFNRTVVAPGLPAQFHRETRQLLSSGVCEPTVRSEPYCADSWKNCSGVWAETSQAWPQQAAYLVDLH